MVTGGGVRGEGVSCGERGWVEVEAVGMSIDRGSGKGGGGIVLGEAILNSGGIWRCT
jgi:hypothetical protein